MRKTDLAWAAGIIDGEGCVTIVHHGTYKPNGCRAPTFVLMVKVTMGHRPTVERLRAIFGEGTVQNHVPRGPRINASYSWIVQALKAERALRAVQPYLVTKAKEVKVGLQFAALPRTPKGGRGGSRRVSESLRRRREAFYWRLRMLKSRWRFRKGVR